MQLLLCGNAANRRTPVVSYRRPRCPKTRQRATAVSSTKLFPSEPMTTKLERLDHSVSHEWHVAVNACATERGHDDWPKFMYEAHTAADEVPRMALLFRLEREAKLRQTHQHCSHCEPEPVKDNHLTCCLGTKCRECPFLLALETAKLTPEQIDQAKAWTCAAHIISKGGDMMGEGYLLTVDDRMYWDRLHSSLASAYGMVEGDEEEGNA